MGGRDFLTCRRKKKEKKRDFFPSLPALHAESLLPSGVVAAAMRRTFGAAADVTVLKSLNM